MYWELKQFGKKELNFLSKATDKQISDYFLSLPAVGKISGLSELNTGNIFFFTTILTKNSGFFPFSKQDLIFRIDILETCLNAQQEAYEYISSYTLSRKEVNRSENVIGWYHSYPGYGCWLPSIDVDK